jgi:hypothetical protein
LILVEEIPAVGFGFTVIITVDVTAGQGPAGSLVVNVSVTVPLVIEGVYVDVSEFAFEKLPEGALHVELVAPPPIVPASVILLPAQTACTGPAFAVATGLIVITTVDVTGKQGPAGSLVVKVSVTVPLVMDGVYVDVSEFIFEKLPLGALHTALVALPPILPANVTDPPAQTVCVVPALTVAIGLTVIITVDVTAGQGPAGSSVVRVNVTVPLAIEGV